MCFCLFFDEFHGFFVTYLFYSSSSFYGIYVYSINVIKSEFAIKIEDFLRTGDSLIVTHSDGEIRNTYKNLKNFKPLKISDDYLILTRL